MTKTATKNQTLGAALKLTAQEAELAELLTRLVGTSPDDVGETRGRIEISLTPAAAEALASILRLAGAR